MKYAWPKEKEDNDLVLETDCVWETKYVRVFWSKGWHAGG